MQRRKKALAGLLLFAQAECAWWGLVVTVWWAFRDFVVCWTPCPDRPDIIAQRTLEAAGLSIWLAINLVAVVIFGLSRKRKGLIVLGGVEVVDLAFTLLVGVMFASSSELMTAVQWWSGSLIAAVTLGLLYLLNGLLDARRDGTPRSG